ncbi:hypothetical protein [Acinetobacter baumannii]|uniref:hypothetical protein n=1 Tax=Acinetobacter baumannii TaxID=470 RepID=UPI0011BE8F38|nr:hypothetical protein [Acinetobacter baumannii]
MEKCREDFEQSLERTDGFHDGYVTWNEASGMYMANDDDYESMADWMNGAFAIHRKMQAKVEELQKRVEAALKLTESWNEIAFDRTTHWTEGYEEGCYHCAAQLEQALKGENK